MASRDSPGRAKSINAKRSSHLQRREIRDASVSYGVIKQEKALLAIYLGRHSKSTAVTCYA